MSGELNLEALLVGLTATLLPETYVFATLKGQAMPQGLAPRMQFQEAEGTTLIVTRAEAEAAGVAHEFACRMITLDVHSSLEAVGFIAVIARELAEAGIGVNPVAGFYHDHLFVPEARVEDAMRILKDLADAASDPA